MAELVSRLQALKPVVEKICAVSGTTGVSVGVIHGSKVIWTDNFGFRNVKEKLPPDQDTIYYLSSLSKSFTAAGIAHLIHEGSGLTWAKPVSEAYPPLSHEDPEIRARANILDFLSHRTGLAPKNHIWSQEFGQFTLRRKEDIPTITHLEKIAPFRGRWIYNNWGYAVADEMIEHLAHMSWGQFLQDRIFDPIGMPRTVTMRPTRDGNVAKAYVALASGEPWEIVDPDGEDGEILEGAISVRSCVRDLLKYYIAFMKAVRSDEHGAKATESKPPFIDAAKMVEPHIRLSTESPDLDGSYGLGWVRVRLPCTLGAIGLNHGFVGKMPIVGKGIEGRTTCYYHQGSANSFLSSVYLLPETESGVVVLTNSMAQNDAADWLGELYLEAILNNPDTNNYVKLAESSAEAALALWPAMRKELEDARIPNTPVRPFGDYVGLYYNRIGNYHIEIFEKDGSLLMRFQREKSIAYELTHYHYDTFSWLITHDQDAKLGRFPVTRASYYLIKFDSDKEGTKHIDSLIWIHDDEVLEGERFLKRGGHQDDQIKKVILPPTLDRSKSSVVTLATQLGGSVEVIRENENEQRVHRREDTSQLRSVAVIETVLEERTDGVLDTEQSREREEL